MKHLTMKYLITYYHDKNDIEKRYQRHETMQVAIATANLWNAKGDSRVVDSITTEYSVEE
jgi:hypothetical protein